MAAATATLTVNAFPNGVDNTQRRQILHGVCALSSGGTYLTNGIPLNWNAAIDGNSANGSFFIGAWGPQTSQPADAFFYSVLGSGYGYVFDKTHNTLRIFNGGTELANAATITVDTLNFEAEFVRGV